MIVARHKSIPINGWRREEEKMKKYTKSQLNAISRYYTEQDRKWRAEQLERYKHDDPEGYELFCKSKYKTLVWWEKFCKRVPNREEQRKIVEKGAKK